MAIPNVISRYFPNNVGYKSPGQRTPNIVAAPNPTGTRSVGANVPQRQTFTHPIKSQRG